MVQPVTDPRVQEEEVLSRAVVKASRHLELPQNVLADVLGVSDSSASRLCAGTYSLHRSRKREWEFALLFVRLFRSLDAIVGHAEQGRSWLRSENQGLGARPIEMIRTAEGLVRVLNYLDAYRGRI